MRSEEPKDKQSELSHSDGSPLTTHHSPLTTHHSPPTYSIRLGPPWQVVTTAEGTRHTRKFGRPRTLDANERLWLVCECIPGRAEVRVNGAVVGTVDSAGPFAADMTTLLQQRNEAAFVVDTDAPLGLVVLEVRPA